MSNRYGPWYSLEQGHWFKLICGASFQDLAAIRTLSLAYTLAGADCIDVAADTGAIAAAQEGIAVAEKLSQEATARGFPEGGLPWLMVSLNDGEDPHFRKAEFNPQECPSDCPRPCQSICPAQAIAFSDEDFSGVIDRRCYGCGRCLPVCPSQLIVTRSYVSTPRAVAPWIEEMGIDALEIHTQGGRVEDFQRLWQALSPWSGRLKLVAISCPDAPDLIDYLHRLYKAISPLPCPLIWQTDGRPMSGDLGKGTTHAAIKLAAKVLGADLPGYVQLAGGTNSYTVTKLRSLGLLKRRDKIDKEGKINFSAPSPAIAGIAYGSYARSLLSPTLEKLETINKLSFSNQLEHHPDLLWEAVSQAHALVSQLKSDL